MNFMYIQLDNQKKILIVIFCVLIAYVDLNFILKSQTAGLNSLTPKITRLENDLAGLNRSLEAMRLSKLKIDAPQGQESAKPIKIITESQISGLLEDISQEANKYDIKISQIKPGRQPAQPQSAQAKPQVVSDKVNPYFINLDLVCDYHNFGKFINALEKFGVFMEVADFRISTQATDYIKQKITVTLKTYAAK